MKKNYNVTGSKRKTMAHVVGLAVGIKPVYMKMPTYGYAVGNIIISKNGELIWDERTDDATIQKVVEALAAAGFTATEKAETKTDETVSDSQETTQEQTPEDPERMKLTVRIPTSHHTGNSLRNLINMIYTRAGLINKALGTAFSADPGLVDALNKNERLYTTEDFCKAVAAYEGMHGPALSGITITPDEIRFSSLPETTDTDCLKTFTVLTSMMNKQALKQKRIQAKAVNEENEKYTLRIWLIRLGMNGNEYKTTRKILMEKLSGHSAFRTEAEKERWKQSQVKKHGPDIAPREVTENENQTKRNCGIFAGELPQGMPDRTSQDG